MESGRLYGKAVVMTKVEVRTATVRPDQAGLKARYPHRVLKASHKPALVRLARRDMRVLSPKLRLKYFTP